MRLTKREQEIMGIFWASSEALSANDIYKERSDISKNTIQAVLRKLKNIDMIKVADIGYSGTVLTRLYRPIVTQDEFVSQTLSQKSLKNLVVGFVDTSDAEDLDYLEKLIQEKRDKLNKGK